MGKNQDPGSATLKKNHGELVGADPDPYDRIRIRMIVSVS